MKQPGNNFQTATAPGKKGSYFWVIPVLVSLVGPFMAILDSSIVNVAIPTIMNIFNTDTSTVEWVVTIYMLALGVVVPLSGWLGDKLGFKRLYILSLLVFTFGSLLCSLSWNINSLIAARVVQAVGGGMIMPTTMAMVVRMVPPGMLGGGMGIFGIALLVAPAVGPTLGGYLVEYVNWRWIFTINLPIGVLGTLLSLFLIPDFPPSEAGRLDIGGFLTSAAGLFCLLLALSKGNDWGWRSEPIVLLLYTSVALLALFVYLELTQENPLLELRVFRYPTFTIANILVVVTTIGLYAGIFYLPLFLQTARGLGAMETGLLMMPSALVSGLVMPVVGFLYDRVGPRLLAVTGFAFLTAMTYHFHNLSLATPQATIVLWMVLRGIGMSAANMPPQTAALSVIPPELVGRASAITNILARVSGSFGIAVLTSLLNRRQAFHAANLASHVTATNPELPQFLQQVAVSAGTDAARAQTLGLLYLQKTVALEAFVRGIDDIFVVAAGFTFAGVFLSLFLRKGEGRPRRGPILE